MAVMRSGLVGTWHQPADFLSLEAALRPPRSGTLEARSHRPRQVCQPTWTSALAEQVLALRKQYPRWGKDKLAVLLRRERCRVSISGSAQEFVETRISGCFLKNDEFCFCDRHALCLKQ
jgi:hypothetical protein